MIGDYTHEKPGAVRDVRIRHARVLAQADDACNMKIRVARYSVLRRFHSDFMTSHS